MIKMLGYTSTYQRWLPLGGGAAARAAARMIMMSRLGLLAPVASILLGATVGRHSGQRAEGVILTICLAYLIGVCAVGTWSQTRLRPLLRRYWEVTDEERPSFVCRNPEVLHQWLTKNRAEDPKFQSIEG